LNIKILFRKCAVRRFMFYNELHGAKHEKCWFHFRVFYKR
jgi:hypothetical protein